MNDLSSLSVSLPGNFPDQLASVMRRALEISGWRFSYEGQEFTAEEVTASDGMLPMWIHRAQNLMAEALAGNAPVMEYRVDGLALCGVLPDPQTASASLPIWACFIHYALEDWHATVTREMNLTKGEPVPMDALYKQWQGLVHTNQVVKLPARPQPSAAMSAFAGYTASGDASA